MSSELKKNDISGVLKAIISCTLLIYFIFVLADISNFSPNIIKRMGGAFLLFFNCLILQIPLGLFYIVVSAVIEKYYNLQNEWHKWWFYPISSPILLIIFALIGERLG